MPHIFTHMGVGRISAYSVAGECFLHQSTILNLSKIVKNPFSVPVTPIMAFEIGAGFYPVNPGVVPGRAFFGIQDLPSLG